MTTPTDRQYMSSHEWIKEDGDVSVVGITDFAQDQLGDVVYVELPEVGRQVTAGETVAVVESVKTASDIYSPATGEIVEVNDALSGSPELINEGALEGGWLFKIRVDSLSADLMDAASYDAANN
ncbi:glycine cleavage system protein GcvH [Deinococcus aquiradiocola]|uniref:Glycine cleavage system H protein n=1 Tax=Deinococcus aquiradiocola TaxID=393059 RepID=A0A917PQ84_9DEIO|nr:glycine cleavage system protein GcvH [Deinococcus aquiradiocola]GGJ87638.1 glycine cleavage system H protein [Deinococcus aquiradiocola]